MLKTALNMLIGAMITAAVATAFAVTGVPPTPGQGPLLPDGNWLLGVANGVNFSYQSGITAAGTTQATATQLPAATNMVEVDTTASSTGVALPPALPGTNIQLYNNGANTLSVYPTVPNNPVTSAQDTINNGTSFSGGVATHVLIDCFAAKAGIWACK